MIARVRGCVVPVAVRRLVVVVVALCGVACWLPAASLAQLSWSKPAAVDHNGHQSLGGVACPSATQCTAFDFNGQQVTFDPASPGTPTPTAIDANGPVGVACPSATQCTAVDFSGQQVTFDPASPGTPTPTTIDTSHLLLGVACPSAAQCTAVDNTGQQVTFHPASPGTPTPTTIDPNSTLTAIACVSADECTAIDATGHETTARATTPGRATVEHISTSGATISVRVSCTGNTSCNIKLTASVLETIRRGKVIAVAASTKTTKKTITIVSKTATIPARSTKTIKLTLNRAGKQLLAEHHPLKAKLTVTQSRKTVTSRTITLQTEKKKG
jgi:hypothetical protein